LAIPEQALVAMNLVALLVEDNDLMAHVLRAALLRANLTVRTAQSVDEGVRALESRCPDLLVLDDQLPDGRGIDVASAALDIHGRHRRSPLPIIALNSKPAARHRGLGRPRLDRAREDPWAVPPDLPVRIHQVDKPIDRERFDEILRDAITEARHAAELAAMPIDVEVGASRPAPLQEADA
jgi:CheY-like chemotaxis protein